MQSHRPLCNGRLTLDGFRRYAHARLQAESGLVSIKLVIGPEKDFVLRISGLKQAEFIHLAELPRKIYIKVV